MNNPVSPLSRALPAVDAMAARLYRFACDVRLARKLTDLSLGNARVAPSHLASPKTGGVLWFSNNTGRVRINYNLIECPALAAAASIPEVKQRNAMAALLLSKPLAQLEAIGFAVREVELQPLNGKNHMNDAPASVNLQLENMEVQISIDDKSLLVALEQSIKHLPLPAMSTGGKLLLAGRVRLGGRYWPRAALRNLRAGDVLLAPLRGLDAKHGADQAADLTWGDRRGTHLHSHCTIQGTTMTLQDTPELRDGAFDAPLEQSEFSDTNPLPGRDGAPDLRAGVEALAIPVHFELDAPALTIAEISALCAGYVFELPMPVDRSRIRLSACGQILAWGELVAIGGQLGVRITHTGAGDDRPE